MSWHFNSRREFAKKRIEMKQTHKKHSVARGLKCSSCGTCAAILLNRVGERESGGMRIIPQNLVFIDSPSMPALAGIRSRRQPRL